MLATVALISTHVSDAAAQNKNTRQAPSIDALIQSMVNYHPYVRAINEGNYQAAAELEIARSSFDPFIEQKTSSRVSGYYDGTNLTQRFSNPFEDFNGSVYTEYRISDGDFRCTKPITKPCLAARLVWALPSPYLKIENWISVERS